MCPKTQDTRGMSARCYIVQRQGIFALVFPRSKIICLPSLIRSVPRSTYEFRQFRRNPRVYIYIFKYTIVISIFDFIGIGNSLFESFLRFLLE